jgi:hypothetical protein
MKKIFVTLILLVASTLVIAQDSSRIFKPFKVDISLGYAIPQGSNIVGGALFSIEPKYALADPFALGLRLEVAATARKDAEGNVGDVHGTGSVILTGDYYFTKTHFRPLIGGGLGYFKAGDYTNADTDFVFNSKFGFMLRGGFEWGHFRMGVEYNLVSKESDIKNGYLGLKLGVVLGGGRIKKLPAQK